MRKVGMRRLCVINAFGKKNAAALPNDRHVYVFI
jgi:hypothetical protein